MDKAKARLRLTNPCHLLAVGLGSGLSPIVPGTMGSLMAIPLWLIFKDLPLTPYLLLLVLSFVLGVYLCDKTSKDMGVHDHGSIVWDEFVGMWMTLLVIPVHSWQWVLIAFIAFRIFDMWKPWPIRWFDRYVHGGFGIMIDDVIAALFAMAAVAALAHYWPGLGG